MSLVRTGTLLFGVGLTVALLWVVAFGPATGCTDAACPGHAPAYSLAAPALRGGALPTLGVSDGCTACPVAPAVLYGAVGSAAGLVAAAAGQVRRLSVA